MTTLKSLIVAVTTIGIDGVAKAGASTRPLRIVVDGPNKGQFAVMISGKCRVATPTGASSISADLRVDAFDPALTRAAKMADLGLMTKAEAKALEPKKPLTPGQEAALAAGRAKVRGPATVVPSDATGATMLQALLAKMPKEAKLALIEGLLKEVAPATAG